MKRQLFLLGLLAVALAVVPAMADPLIFELTKRNTTNLGSPGSGAYGTVSLDFNAGVITVNVTMDPSYWLFGNNDAFGFNVKGTTAGVMVSGQPSSFTLASSGNEDGFGDFAFRLDYGLQKPKGVPSLTFQVSRPGDNPFTSAWDLVQLSSSPGQGGGGNLSPFAAHIVFLGSDCGGSQCTGYVASGDNPIPEPSTAILLGSGLLGAAGLLKRKLRAKKATIS